MYILLLQTVCGCIGQMDTKPGLSVKIEVDRSIEGRNKKVERGSGGLAYC